jgi:hypothetical protein
MKKEVIWKIMEGYGRAHIKGCLFRAASKIQKIQRINS